MRDVASSSVLARREIKEMYFLSPSGHLLKLPTGQESTMAYPPINFLGTEQMGKGGVCFQKGK